MAMFRSSALSVSKRPICAKCIWRCTAASIRLSSATADAAPPPLLAKIKADLKTAMRARDTSRLNVLRAVISETNQAASGPSPIKTDLQILALLRKRKAASRAAAKEAEDAKREDLKEKQEKEIEILDEYASAVKTVPVLELRTIVRGAVEALRSDRNASPSDLKPGVVMKELLKPGGVLDGKPVENAQLAEIVRETIMSKQT